MRIVRMNGGLGNQAFQYIFLRFLEIMAGEPCIIDDFFFFDIHQHNGYELDRVFSIRHPRLSELFDGDVVLEIIRQMKMPARPRGGKPRGIVSVLREYGLDLFLIQEGDFYVSAVDYTGFSVSVPSNGFFPGILGFSGDIYYYGYWINGHWFRSIMDAMLQELAFPPLLDPKNQKLMDFIQNLDGRSVAVHIRRGDFKGMNAILPPQWYQESIGEIRGKIRNPTFFLFSDDPQWVKENLKEIGLLPIDGIVLVEGNVGGSNYIDMQLMAACRGMIISNSVFSYLAALLNRRPDKIIYNPTWREVV